MIDFEAIINNVTLFHKIYDVIRIVDPVEKEVLYMKKNQNLDVSNIVKSTCYGFWSSGRVCENCISMRAQTENDVFVKFEYVHSRLYLTTAYPLETPYSKYVVEIIKDVTQSELVSNSTEQKEQDIFMNIMSKNRHIITDELTALFNKRYFNEKLPYELINNNLKGFDCAVLMLNVDALLNINHQYGPTAGDYVLKEIASILNECIREDYDWAARLDKDAFVVYLKNIQISDLNRVCEKIQSQVNACSFQYNANTLPVTISIGASHICSSNTCSVEDILKFSKNLLLEAKTEGHNNYVSREVTQ